MQQLDTKYFGRIEYAEEDVLEFPNGLFGFEAEKRFLLLPFPAAMEICSACKVFPVLLPLLF